MNETLRPDLLLAFAPIDKRAFGIAIGVALALAMGLLSVATLLLSPEEHGRLDLLGQFFAGYSVTWTGALIGAAWGFFVGFIAGWFVAFTRNLAVAIWTFAVRTRAELLATRDFLEHI
jgi:MFS family permease